MRSQTRLSGLRNTCIRAKCDNPHVCPATHRCLLYGAGRRTLSDYLICRIFVRAEPFWYLHMYFVQRAAPSQCVFAGVCPDTEQCSHQKPCFAEEVQKTETGPAIVEVDERECSSCFCKPPFCFITARDTAVASLFTETARKIYYSAIRKHFHLFRSCGGGGRACMCMDSAP